MTLPVIGAYMYKYRKSVTAAEGDDTRFEDGMSLLKDDFDYLMETFEKMDRDGSKERAIELMSQTHQSIDDVISQATSEVSE